MVRFGLHIDYIVIDKHALKKHKKVNVKLNQNK